MEGLVCSPEQLKPIGGVTYDAARCDESRDLVTHGVSPASGMGPFIYPFLGGRYRIVYDIAGAAPVSEARFDFLAENLPLASRLASRFSKTRYEIRYVDPANRRFFASRADKLTGEAEMMFHAPAEKRRAFYGWGRSKFGPWTLRGSAYVDIRLRPDPKNPQGILYDVRIRTAPVNAMVNAIMRLGLFKGYVVGQIEDTMKDLVGAAGALHTQGVDALLKDPSFTPQEREKIRALAAIP